MLSYNLQHFSKMKIIRIVLFLFYSRDYITVMESLKDAYFRAEHWSTKRQLLSIVVADLPARLLKAEFLGLTDWKIKAARTQAFFQGSIKSIYIHSWPTQINSL